MADSSPDLESPVTAPADHWLEASHREVQRIVEDCRRGVAKREQAQTAISPRRRAILEALATCLVLWHPRPLIAPLELLQSWSGPGRFPTPSQMKGCMKSAKAMVPGLELDDRMSPWTGGFWHGLRLSRALVVHGGYPRIQRGRPWLAEDLERLPFPGRLSPPDNQGRRWLTRCHAWRLPVADLYAPDVLAGLLAGARRAHRDDGTRLSLLRTESVARLLHWWKLSVCQGSKPGELLVSPFYGALLTSYMPVACGMSMKVKKAGDCPLLPMAIYNTLYGPGRPDEGYLLPPRAGLLPWLCSHPTRSRRGWSREFLHRAAVKLGVHHIPAEQRRLLEQWRSSARSVV